MHRLTLIFALALTATLFAAGCETTTVTSDGRPMPPEPRPAPVTPESAPVTTMALRYGAKPADTNGNGFGDLIAVEVYLFAEPHPAPVHEPGAFEFALYRPGESESSGSEPLAAWRIETDAAATRQMHNALFGRGYLFELSLLDVGSDRYAPTNAHFFCRFIPADGSAPVRSGGTHWMQIGGQALAATQRHRPSPPARHY